MRLLRFGYFFMGLSGIGLVVIASLWVYSARQADERLAVQVAKVRARGEPLTTVELNDYYQPAENRPDVTKEIMAALAVCDAAELKSLAAKLPIVGTGPEPSLPPNAWPQLEEVEAYLLRQASALEAFRQLSQHCGTARFPVDFTPGVATLLPQTQSMRQASRVLSLQFYVHLNRGRTGDAVECLLDQLALAQALDQEPIIISQLVRLALVNVTVSHVQQAVRSTDISDADLARLQHELRKLECESCLKRAMAGERAIGYTVCVEPRLADGTLTMTQAEAQQMSSRSPKRVADATKLLELSLRIAEAADQSIFNALQESVRIETEVKGLSEGVWNRFSYIMTMLLSPAYKQATTAFARLAARRDTTDSALAAELFRRRRGQWPETLEQLVPEFLPRVPLDPFNNQPLKMISTDDELKVYSVGGNGIDDNGNFTKVDDPNSDIGFVIPLRRGAPRL
jgi:hypothetical protein